MEWITYETVIYHPGALPSTSPAKIAAFDLDSTLIYSNRGEKAASNGWVWAYSDTSEKLHQLHNEGYILVIFSNRSGPPWMVKAAQKRVETVIKTLNLPFWVFFSLRTGTKKNPDPYRKPAPGMMSLFLSLTRITEYDPASFYSGDAVGAASVNRWWRWSDADAEFAKSIGLPFKTPTEVFTEFPDLAVPPEIDLVLTIGQYGSGWDEFIPFVGDVYDTNGRNLIFLDDRLELPSPPKDPVYFVIGTHPTHQDRERIRTQLGIADERTLNYIFFRPDAETHPENAAYTTSLELPPTYQRAN